MVDNSLGRYWIERNKDSSLKDKLQYLFEEPEQEEKTQAKKEISTRLIVECGDVSKLSMLFSELQDRGFKCELKE